MGNVIKGDFVPKQDSEVDRSKNYICYFCEEEITFVRDQWRHVTSQIIPCQTVATPSNLEL